MEPQDTIFLKARDMADPAEQAAYLTQACANDADLRQRVEAMLRDATGANEFFGPEGTVVSTAPVTESPGTVIGRFKLLQKIGEGGMGVVYMAEQREPVIRKVALKIIKLGMDTRQVVARFEAERQALALMDHPNIAKVLDGGATQSGRPYFVMDLVPGLPITQFCDEANLSTRDRLELFLEVCSAIQHAHQKGIIHRDIKPSNILVTLHGDRPVPKVIDFGVAKATQGRLTDKTLFTQFQQFIGTPAYMSPEQASLSGLDIDTRSDIYALGVLLYELLTGRTPFDGNELLQAGLEEMRRTIREEQPPRPSHRISTLQGEDLTTTAKQRRTDPPKLIHLVRGDLDWIVMKALEKDRARRYETANGLAADIKRHINCEPVVARPPSWLYEFQKTVRRHKFGFAAAAALITVLAVGAVVSTLEAIRATRAEHEQIRLREAAQQEQANEARLRQEAEADRAKAETEAAKSQQVSQFLKDMLISAGPDVALGRDTTLLREILDKTVDRVNKDLTNLPEVQGQLLNASGWGYWSILELAKADAAFRQASAIQRKVLGKNDPALADTLFGLGQVLADEHRPEESEHLYRESLEIRQKAYGNEHWTVAACLNNLTGPLVAQGKLAEAESFSRQALAMKRKVFPNGDPEVAISLRDLGFVLRVEGKLDEAERSLREGLAAFRAALGDTHTEVARALEGLADVLSSEGKLAEAETAEHEALAIKRKLFKPDNPSLLSTRNKLVAILLAQHKDAEAGQLFGELATPGADSQSHSAAFLRARRAFFARHGRWKEAAADTAKLIELDPADHTLYHGLASLLVADADLDAYRQQCQLIVARFGGTNNPLIAGRMAKSCLTLAPSGADSGVVERWVEAALVDTNAVAVPWNQVVKGMAEYRLGHYAGAADWMQKALSHTGDNLYRDAEAWIVLAMAYQQSNQNNHARAAWDSGVDLVNTKLPKLESGDIGGQWFDWIIVQALMREARPLIEGRSKENGAMK